LKNNSSVTHIERNLITFGLGKHACPGRQFAMNVIKFALHYLLLNYDIKKVSNEKIRPKCFGPYKVPSKEGLIFENKA
jgi:cytochrome P450